MANGIVMLEEGPYQLRWYGHPERHFIIYKNGVAILLTKFEKEAIKSFSALKGELKNENAKLQQ